MQQLHELQFRETNLQSRRGAGQSRGVVCVVGRECLNFENRRFRHVYPASTGSLKKR